MAFVQSPTIAPPISTGSMTVGAIQNNWDALMEDFDAVAYLPFGDEYWDAMNQIMNAVGNREIAKNPRVRWFELTRMEAPILVSGTPAGGNTGFDVTIDASSVTTVGTIDYSWPNVGDLWKDALTGSVFQIVDKPAADNLIMVPLVAGGTITTDGYMYYVGNSAPENGGAYASKFAFDEVKTSFLQTFRNDTKSSSEALYNQLWYSQLESGVQTPYSNSRDIIYLQREHQVAIVNAFFAGSQTDAAQQANLVTPAGSSTSFQTTTGLLNAILNNGSGANGGGISTVIPTGAGTVVAQDFYDLEAALSSQDGSVKNYMVWTSGYMQSLLEQQLFTEAGAVSPLNYNVTVNKVQMEKTFWGEGAYADLMSRTFSFNSLVFNNKNFGFVRMGIFDNPTMFGVGADSAENDWKQYAFFIPLSTNGGVDDGIGNMGKYVRLAHKPGAFMNMWQTGGRAAANKTENWELGVHIVSEIAFKFINANKYGLMTA